MLPLVVASTSVSMERARNVQVVLVACNNSDWALVILLAQDSDVRSVARIVEVEPVSS